MVFAWMGTISVHSCLFASIIDLATNDTIIRVLSSPCFRYCVLCLLVGWFLLSGVYSKLYFSRFILLVFISTHEFVS